MRSFNLLVAIVSVPALGLCLGCGSDDDGTPKQTAQTCETPPCDEEVPKTGSFQLAAQDACGPTGADPLAGATVSWGGDSVVTGANGEVLVEDLEPGDYTLTVSMDGYLDETVTVTVEADGVATGGAEMTCHRLLVGERARDYLEGLSADGAYSPVIKAGDVFDNFMDGDVSNDPQVISVRSPDHYALGHVPGAINIPWKSVADDASLALLGDPSADARFVDYCYTGHTGGIAAGVLNLLGYPTANMKYGFAVWTQDTTALAEWAVYPDQTNDFAIETTVNEATDTHELPWMDFGDVADGWEATQAAAQAYLGNEDMKPTISATDLFDNLNDGDTSNDPFIISVRSSEHYAIGHVPGAINIPWKEVALEENLRKIPTDREIVVYCYTGHTGGIATSVLGVLGYHKVRNLKYGFMSWTQDADARVAGPFDPASEGNDFPIVTGNDPGTF